MRSGLRDFVMHHPMFSHHDHHCCFKDIEENKSQYTAAAMLGYADADLESAAGTNGLGKLGPKERTATSWPMIATTGYGQAVTLGCRALFDLDYSAQNFDAITEKLQGVLNSRSAPEMYDYFVMAKANVEWVLQDSYFAPANVELLNGSMYPEYYRFAWRMDDLFSICSVQPIELLEKVTGITVNTLDDLTRAMNANIDRFKETGRLAAFKIGIAYLRDLVIRDPSAGEAERALSRIRGGNANAAETRPLADHMLHRLFQRASDEDIPVQIHTGYLAGHWGSLAGTKALHLLPVFQKYTKVRFDVFHCSWPWASELGAIAKNYPNVYPDMCWAWTMNPSEAERALGEWLDAVPYNKIFGFGADTSYPWCEAGYAVQARLGIARALEKKMKKGFFSEATAREVASAIMIDNGKEFHRVG